MQQGARGPAAAPQLPGQDEGVGGAAGPGDETGGRWYFVGILIAKFPGLPLEHSAMFFCVKLQMISKPNPFFLKDLKNSKRSFLGC